MSQTVLFVCIENAGRSQMAEGFFRKYTPGGYVALSAGTTPTEKINPLAIQAMKEIGIDIADQKPKVLTDEMIRRSSKIVNMGCMDSQSCPALFVNNMIEWSIPEPKNKPIDEVRKIRDEIEIRIMEFVATLD